MKKVFLFAFALVTAASLFANTGTRISEKALKAFNATFKNAENIVWTDADNVYTVKFTQQGVSTYVKYDEDGNFISSRRYYLAEQLPVDIQCKLKKKFSDKTIFGVSEFTIGDEVSYYVKLEDVRTWTTVKIDNARNIEVTEKFLKAD
jgi:hypothetical protein